MKLLLLGGTRFAGRAVVTAALERGWQVTTFTRGSAHPGAEPVHGDRSRAGDLRALDGNWDAVLDTWSAEPAAVRESAGWLAGRAAHYVYLSSRAVCAEPERPGLTEESSTVDLDAAGEYARNKRGGELAVLAGFGDRALLVRAGSLFGPGDERLARWVRRVAAGGEVLAPAPPDQPFRYVDVRDLAEWLLDAVEAAVCGPVNLVNPPDHTTTASLLDALVRATGADVRLNWLDEHEIEAAGLSRRAEFPGWVPPALAGLVFTDDSRARATGLRCRPVLATVADTRDYSAARIRPSR